MKQGFSLRSYQHDSEKNTGDLLRQGYKRVAITLPTGAGKTALFIDMANKIFKSGKKVLIVMRRRSLIFQTAKSFNKFTGHTPSIIMGSEKGFDKNNGVQVCSIDTVTRRINKPEYEFLLDFDYIFVDEMHDSTSPKYVNFLQMFEDKFWVGLSATIMPTGNKYLADVGWQKVVETINSAWLRDNGYLVEDMVYAPAKIDVSGIKTRAGDFDQKSLAERASESRVVGDLVKTWQEFGESRPTLLFAVNKEHSKLCAEAFRQAGIPAMHQDESHSTAERDDAIEKLIGGEIKILCSIGIFSTGTDIPQASCGIFARPTKSEILYVQQIGRVLRPYKQCSRCNADCGAEEECFRCGSKEFKNIKPNAILLDHANNCERFGLAYDPRPPKLHRPKDKKRKVTDDTDIPKTKTCASCFAVYSMNELSCPYCNHVNETKKRMIEHEEGELRRITADNLNISRLKKTLDKYYQKELRYNLKPAFKYFKLYEDHGDMIFDYSKELELPSWLKGIIKKKEAQESTKELLN